LAEERLPDTLNVGDAAYDPVFAFGYGLTYARPHAVPVLDEISPSLGCGATGGGGTFNVQQDAKKATWTGSGPGQIYAQISAVG
jgi:hypothetical protein